MTETPSSVPRTVALSLISTTALDEAARQAPGADVPMANWELYHNLTATLKNWEKGGTLRADSLLLTEWLAVEMVACLAAQFEDETRMERWLADFGDEVCRVQQHAHPAGPTAIEILSVIAADMAARPEEATGAERLIRIGAPYLAYIRTGHEVEDAREVTLTFALWAGNELAALMHHDAERITAYMNARA